MVERPVATASGVDPRVASAFAALMERLKSTFSETGLACVEGAFEIAAVAHAGQGRKSGEPYLMHPLRVAQGLADLGLGAETIAAGLLHDSVEDSELTVFEVSERFGRDVANIVDGVTKLGKVPYLSRKEQQAESFRKMLLAMSQDIRVLVVKLHDRLDNMRTLEHMPADKRERIARETFDIYGPLAGRLGLEPLQRELMDLGFRYLEPVVYEQMRARMDELTRAHPDFSGQQLERLRWAFRAPPAGSELEPWDEASLGAVEFRALNRSVYEVYLDAQRARAAGNKRRANAENSALELSPAGETELEQVSDLFVYNIVVPTRATCYLALGQTHAAFQPVPGGFRDQIALARGHRQQCLITTLVDRSGARLELQIRSETMDLRTQRGILLDLDPVDGRAHRRHLAWLDEIMDWQEEVSDPNEFIEAVRADLFADEVHVFTPEGDVRSFPKGSTPIDFAFSIHTDVGVHCAGARINGQVVPLRYRMRNGDTVEILTNPNVEPRREWLGFCKSSRARAKIKQHLRHREKSRNVGSGRSLLEQRLARRGLTLAHIERAVDLAEQLEALGVARERGAEGIYEDVGSGRITPEQVVWLFDPSSRTEDAAGSGSRFVRMLKRVAGRLGPEPRMSSLPGASAKGDASAPIELDKETLGIGAGGDGFVQLAPCCEPVIGDALAGYFVPGAGIVAHAQACPRALDHVEERRVYLRWAKDLELERPATLEVRSANAVGLLAKMSRAFSRVGVDIKQANCRALDDARRALNTFHVTVRNLSQLDDVIAELRQIRGVIGVERTFPGAKRTAPRERGEQSRDGSGLPPGATDTQDGPI